MMSPSSEMRAMKLTTVPKGLNTTSVAKPVAIRIGISPPDWMTAFCPLIASSFGCARIVASPSLWRIWMTAVMFWLFGRLKAYVGLFDVASKVPSGSAPPPMK